EAFPEIKNSGASLIIVEQDIVQAMKVSDRVCCMMEGNITLSETPDELSMDMIHAAYFGEEQS
ncbi:MAG: ABC transporter ATP-binding protein, partial [Rhodobacteraceae bacterium]|nr:ABC transporter ATP-binding protein [Paracoccaceae bacterium]